jgi:EmrB/QacA subfamily drug resistance transporter
VDGPTAQARIEAPALTRAGEPLEWRRWLGLAVILLAAFMDFLDASIVAVAAPSIRADLHASYSAVQWFVAGYTLPLALVLITGSRLGDRFGRRRVFVLGMIGFTSASILCGAAQSPEMLIASRVTQGLMAGVMLPQVLAMIQVNFTKEEQGKAVGMYGATAGLAYVGAPLIGGLLIQADVLGLGWRTVFLLNVPVCASGLAGSLWMVKESRGETRSRLDLAGVTLLTLGLFLLVYPLVEGRDLRWPVWIFAMLAGSIFVLASFIRRQLKEDKGGGSPLVAIHLFRERSFGVGTAAGFVLVFGAAAFLLVYSLTLQIGYGFSALHVALTLLPWPVVFIAGSAVSGSMPEHGKGFLALASVLLAVSMVAQIVTLGQIDGPLHSWQLMPALALGGLGAGFSFPAVTNVALPRVDARDAGGASGVVNTAFQLGAATGVAVLGAVFFGLLVSHASASASNVAPQIRSELNAAGVPLSAARDAVRGFDACFHARMTATDPSSVPPQCRGARLVGRGAAVAAGRDDFRHAFRWTLWWEVAVFLVALALALSLPRRRQTTSEVCVDVPAG